MNLLVFLSTTVLKHAPLFQANDVLTATGAVVCAATMYRVTKRKNYRLRLWLLKQMFRLSRLRILQKRKEVNAAAVAVVLGALAISVFLIIIEPLIGLILLGSFILIFGMTALALKKR